MVEISSDTTDVLITMIYEAEHFSSIIQYAVRVKTCGRDLYPDDAYTRDKLYEALPAEMKTLGKRIVDIKIIHGISADIIEVDGYNR